MIVKFIEEKGAKVGKYQNYPFDMALFAKPHEMDGVFLEKLECLEVDYEYKDLELLIKWIPDLTTLKQFWMMQLLL